MIGREVRIWWWLSVENFAVSGEKCPKSVPLISPFLFENRCDVIVVAFQFTVETGICDRVDVRISTMAIHAICLNLRVWLMITSAQKAWLELGTKRDWCEFDMKVPADISNPHTKLVEAAAVIQAPKLRISLQDAQIKSVTIDNNHAGQCKLDVECVAQK